MAGQTVSGQKKALLLPMLVAVIIIDQFTKYIADTSISPSAPIRVTQWFYLVNVKNTGAAFGMLKGMGNEFFIGLTSVAIVFIAVLTAKSREGILGLMLILGGAIGNLIDRLFYGSVRDFIDVSIGSYHWPAFNVADSALTVGIFLMLLGPAFRKAG